MQVHYSSIKFNDIQNVFFVGCAAGYHKRLAHRHLLPTRLLLRHDDGNPKLTETRSKIATDCRLDGEWEGVCLGERGDAWGERRGGEAPARRPRAWRPGEVGSFRVAQSHFPALKKTW